MSNRISGWTDPGSESLTFNLPTWDKQRVYYPELFTDFDTKCPLCQTHEDTNFHIGLCPSYIVLIRDLIQEKFTNLIDLLSNHVDATFVWDIPSTVRRSPFCVWTSEDTLSYNSEHFLPIYLLCHNFIPYTLSDIFKKHLKHLSSRKELLLLFVQDLITSLMNIIWRQRTTAAKQIELQHNITKRAKLFYKSKHTSMELSQNTSNVNLAFYKSPEFITEYSKFIYETRNSFSLRYISDRLHWTDTDLFFSLNFLLFYYSFSFTSLPYFQILFYTNRVVPLLFIRFLTDCL